MLSSTFLLYSHNTKNHISFLQSAGDCLCLVRHRASLAWKAMNNNRNLHIKWQDGKSSFFSPFFKFFLIFPLFFLFFFLIFFLFFSLFFFFIFFLGFHFVQIPWRNTRHFGKNWRQEEKIIRQNCIIIMATSQRRWNYCPLLTYPFKD